MTPVKLLLKPKRKNIMMKRRRQNQQKVRVSTMYISDIRDVGSRDARPAPPRAKMAAPARPDPEKFQHCPAPPRPAPKKDSAAPPRKY